jgi:hypothetical protein
MFGLAQGQPLQSVELELLEELYFLSNDLA